MLGREQAVKVFASAYVPVSGRFALVLLQSLFGVERAGAKSAIKRSLVGRKVTLEKRYDFLESRLTLRRVVAR